MKDVGYQRIVKIGSLGLRHGIFIILLPVLHHLILSSDVVSFLPAPSNYIPVLPSFHRTTQHLYPPRLPQVFQGSTSLHPLTPFSLSLYLSLSLSVSPQYPWLPLLTSEEQPCQPVQLSRPGARHGLRERLCRRRAQHLRGERQPAGLPVPAAPPRAPLQRRQSNQPWRSAGHAARQWQDALRRRLQWCGVTGRWNFCNNLPCRSPAA